MSRCCAASAGAFAPNNSVATTARLKNDAFTSIHSVNAWTAKNELFVYRWNNSFCNFELPSRLWNKSALRIREDQVLEPGDCLGGIPPAAQHFGPFQVRLRSFRRLRVILDQVIPDDFAARGITGRSIEASGDRQEQRRRIGN